MMQEALNTSKLSERRTGEPLRKQPMVFVKAKEMYDPRAILEKVTGKEDASALSVSLEKATLEENEPDEHEEQANEVRKQEMVADEVESVIDNTEGAESEDLKISAAQISKPDANIPTTDDIESELDEQEPESDDESESEIGSESDSFYIDNSGDAISVPSPTENPLGPNTVFDPVLTIGNVQLHTKRFGNHLESVTRAASGYTQLDLGSELSDSESDEEAYADYIRQLNGLSDSDDSESDDSINSDVGRSQPTPDDSATPDTIEYGFLPEDYEFDVSQMSVANVRFGIKNQFFTRCLELTGSVDDYTWIDEEELIDFVTQKGVKEHRLDSFLTYITNGMVSINKNEDSQDESEDVYVSSDSESDREAFAGTEPQDDDGIDDLVAFAKQLTKFGDTVTARVETVGAGLRKQLDLERFSQYELCDDIIDSLQLQYQLRRESKKNKRQKHLEALLEEGINKYNLLLKYPYTLHIKDIRDEFEAFLHNPARDDLSFPPLDPHGNKTLTKMAGCYNCKSATQGKGLKRYIRVTKYKRTFKYLPDYGHINAILRQRPLFNRVDQKRPKEEYVATDGNANKDRIRQRNKSGHSAVVPEGHIVGGMAPEIGNNNVGRQLLEKLGWIKGEGLGAHGRKGISEPLVATVKKSKTGLGQTSRSRGAELEE